MAMLDDLPPLDPARKFHQMADEAKATIARLSAERDATKDRAERKSLNSRIHSVRGVERWIRTRQGYADEAARMRG
jgi:hypothetical protein